MYQESSVLCSLPGLQPWASSSASEGVASGIGAEAQAILFTEGVCGPPCDMGKQVQSWPLKQGQMVGRGIHDDAKLFISLPSWDTCKFSPRHTVNHKVHVPGIIAQVCHDSSFISPRILPT